MLIANQLKKKNRAEYLLYMWQVEDIIRAYHCDIDELKQHYLQQFNVDNNTRQQMETWYENLCRMMQEEGLKETGHLQINKICMQQLNELHLQLLQSTKFPYYRSTYYKILPYIVELRSKNAKEETELQTCFDALYGVMMLRLQKKDVSPETEKATKDISTFLGMLSDYYLKNESEPIEF